MSYKSPSNLISHESIVSISSALEEDNLTNEASYSPKREFSTTSLPNPPQCVHSHITSHPIPKTMEDSDGLPLFAFQDLEYIPSGFGGILAPYIETTAGTMRAAATLMRLGLQTEENGNRGGNETLIAHQEVVCDLGCGDGYFRT
jgi:hypothetical protein